MSIRLRFSALAVAFALTFAMRALATERPNILFIYTDDQAPTAVGSSNNELKTPHIDRIFQEGVILANSFVTTPVCSPSRAGLAVSRYGSELGIIDWINPRSEPELGLDPNTITWMELLQEAGYRTGLFGKWHLGTADRYHPTLSGYHEFVGIRTGGCPPKDAVIEIGGHNEKQSGYTCDIFTDHALAFIEKHRTAPFARVAPFPCPARGPGCRFAPRIGLPTKTWIPPCRIQTFRIFRSRR